jgi:hypothetical protein
MARRPIQYPNIALSPTARAIMRELSPLLSEIDANFTEVYAGGLSELETALFTDGTNNFRIQVRDGALMFDEAMTPLGFDGAENTDWKKLYEMKLEV